MRQRDLLRRMGFPATEAAVRILRKVPLEVLSQERIAQLRAVVGSPDSLKALSHLQVIPASVIALAADPALFRWTSPAFMAELAGEDNDREESAAADLLRETVHMQETMHPGRVTRIESVARLRRIHDELRTDYTRWIEARLEAAKFPASPVPALPKAIEPLESAEDLVREGREQSNCAAAYASRARQGEVFLYRVLQPERATLSLVRRPKGHWEIDQLKASYNRPVLDQTRELIEHWLEEWMVRQV